MRQEEEDQWSEKGIELMILSIMEWCEGLNSHWVRKINRFLECGEIIYIGGERGWTGLWLWWPIRREQRGENLLCSKKKLCLLVAETTACHMELHSNSARRTKMFNKQVDVDKRIFWHCCKAIYGLYGLFTTYLLCTTVLNSDAYELINFEMGFQYSGENHHSDPQFANYFDSLMYDDKNYFTVDEIRFLLEISAPCELLGDKQVDTDLKEVMTDVKWGNNMLKSHLKIVLKAIQYWNLRYNKKYEKYYEEFCNSNEVWLECRVTVQD